MQDSILGSFAGTLTDRWTHPAVILVASELSDLEQLMPFAFEQAAQTRARLILLHVLRGGAGMAMDSAGMPYYDPSAAVEFATKALNPYCEEARRRGMVCDALLREGNAAQQIAVVARQFHADRLLIGTRGRSRLGKLLLGSVAEQVLRSVNLPVMTVGPEAHLQADGSDRQAVVLHATTLGETSRPSAVLACQVAASQNARLLLLHVLPPIDEMEHQGLPTGLDSAAMHELRLLAEQTGASCRVPVEAIVVHGNPHIEILAQAAEQHAGLIVLGTSSRSAFENLTRDRVVFRVLAHARCPVLTLHAPIVTPAETLAVSVAMQN
jgi:nucleotide-binding universal stress UspA family protein